MPFNATDKWEMTQRQAKVDLGQGRGNSITNAINWAIAKGLTIDQALELSDKIFHYSQVRIEENYKAWLEANEMKIKAELGLIEEVIQEQAL